MAAKVTAVLDLIDRRPELRARVFSGLEVGLLGRLLADPSLDVGTRLG
jgi:hypothetical protein